MINAANANKVFDFFPPCWCVILWLVRTPQKYKFLWVMPPEPRSSFFFVIASERVAIQSFFFVILDPESRTQVIVLLCHCERTRGNPVDALLLQSQINWIAAVVTLPRNDNSVYVFKLQKIPHLGDFYSQEDETVFYSVVVFSSNFQPINV